MGLPTPKSSGCEVIRITMDDDVTTPSGLEKAIRTVTDSPFTHKTMVWVSIPCVGGSQLQRMNKNRGASTRKLLAKRLKTYRDIWDAFEKVLTACHEAGAIVCIEWPTSCDYWSRREVVRALRKYQFVSSYLHGCRYGLESENRSTRGSPILKPWRIASTASAMLTDLDRKCSASGDECCITAHKPHVPCQGRDAQVSESYTDEFVGVVHDNFRRICTSVVDSCLLCASAAISCLPETADQGFPDFLDQFLMAASGSKAGSSRGQRTTKGSQGKATSPPPKPSPPPKTHATPQGWAPSLGASAPVAQVTRWGKGSVDPTASTPAASPSAVVAVGDTAPGSGVPTVLTTAASPSSVGTEGTPASPPMIDPTELQELKEAERRAKASATVVAPVAPVSSWGPKQSWDAPPLGINPAAQPPPPPPRQQSTPVQSSVTVGMAIGAAASTLCPVVDPWSATSAYVPPPPPPPPPPSVPPPAEIDEWAPVFDMERVPQSLGLGSHDPTVAYGLSTDIALLEGNRSCDTFGKTIIAQAQVWCARIREMKDLIIETWCPSYRNVIAKAAKGPHADALHLNGLCSKYGIKIGSVDEHTAFARIAGLSPEEIDANPQAWKEMPVPPRMIDMTHARIFAPGDSGPCGKTAISGKLTHPGNFIRNHWHRPYNNYVEAHASGAKYIEIRDQFRKYCILPKKLSRIRTY